MGDGSRDDRTIYVKNLDSKVTEGILFELFLQAGPLVSVKRPKDSEGNSRPFAFVEFEHDVSPPYARSLMDGTKLYGRCISVQFRSGSKHSQDSRGNSPSVIPSYNNGGQSPVPNGFPNFPTPPMIQRSMSAPQVFQGIPGMGPGYPAPLMGNFPMPGCFPGGLAPRPGLMALMQPNQPLFVGHVDQSSQHLSDHHDSTQHHHRHSQEHRRSDGESTPRSHHGDGHRHGHSNSSRHDNRCHGDREQYSDERRHGGTHRHQSHHEHRQERRDHPYRR